MLPLEFIEHRPKVENEAVLAIENGHLLDIIENPNVEKYGNQKMFVLRIRNYAYLVPFVEDQEKIFLKIIIPSRRATKKYLKGDAENDETSSRREV